MRTTTKEPTVTLGRPAPGVEFTPFTITLTIRPNGRKIRARSKTITGYLLMPDADRPELEQVQNRLIEFFRENATSPHASP
jgi:hypothetical protein